MHVENELAKIVTIGDHEFEEVIVTIRDLEFKEVIEEYEEEVLI